MKSSNLQQSNEEEGRDGGVILIHHTRGKETMTEQQVRVGLSACSEASGVPKHTQTQTHTQTHSCGANRDYANCWANEFLNFSLGCCDDNELILAQAHRTENTNHMCIIHTHTQTHIHTQKSKPYRISCWQRVVTPLQSTWSLVFSHRCSVWCHLEAR